jgi:uncharacterized membrane protein YidH (DUF202 family)
MEYFLAFYVAGIALAMYKLYLPSYLTIKKYDPNNILVERKILAFFIMIIGFSIILIGIIPALLSDNMGKRFCTSFVAAVLDNGV